MENDLMIAKTAPHKKSSFSKREICFHFIVALLPSVVVGFVFFGVKIFDVLATCVCASVVFEILFDVLTKNEKDFMDLSSVMFGFLLACVLPATTPIWICVLASGILIAFKKVFEDKRKFNLNIVALTRLFLVLCFGKFVAVAKNINVNTAASLNDLFIGLKDGCFAQVCVVALILGAVYLCIVRIIDWKIPVISLISTLFFFLCFNSFNFNLSLIEILTGEIVFSLLFLATDYSCPTTNLGKVIYSVLLGFFVVIFRLFGLFNEGACLAIIILNLLTFYIDKFAFSIKYKRFKKLR